MASELITTLNDENFDTEVLKSTTPFLVDFWAPWCGPCLRLAPILEEVAKELAGTVKIGKLDSDDFGELAAKYQVKSLPTLMVFKNGAIVETIIGLRTKADIVAKLQAAV